MKLLVSRKMKLPTVYFITDREELKDIPVGVPFMYGDEKSEDYLVSILEYEMLYQEAIKSGFPFNFRKLLEEAGYEGLTEYGGGRGADNYIGYKTEGDLDAPFEATEECNLCSREGGSKFRSFFKDSSAYVDITKLKELKIFPIWLDTIEKAVHTNIHNFAVFNPNMYNKKLEGMYGGID